MKGSEVQERVRQAREVKGHSRCRLSRALTTHNLIISTCELNVARNNLAQCKQRDKCYQAQESEFTKKFFLESSHK